MGSFLQTLDDLWDAGQLRDLERDLDGFIRAHLADLRREYREGRTPAVAVARRRYLRGEISDRQLVDFCVRTALRRRGSCNPGRDIEEQLHEIEREVWFEGERRHGPVSADRRDEIARSWAREHAPRWREWRLYQLLYVWNRKAERYLRLIADPS